MAHKPCLLAFLFLTSRNVGTGSQTPEGNLFAGGGILPHHRNEQEDVPGHLVTVAVPPAWEGAAGGRASGEATGRACEWESRLGTTQKVQQLPRGACAVGRGWGTPSSKPFLPKRSKLCVAVSLCGRAEASQEKTVKGAPQWKATREDRAEAS